MKTITKGGNCLLCATGKSSQSLLLRLDWGLRAADLPGEIDASLFLLNKNGKVSSDADLVFYNQRIAPGGSVRHLNATDSELGYGKTGFLIALDRIPAAVERLAVALTYDSDLPARPLLTALSQAVLNLQEGPGGPGLASYAFAGDIRDESALIVGELYRHLEGWKFRAIGQGFVGGLAALAAHFGVEVHEVPAGHSEPARRKRRSPAEVLAEHTQQMRQCLSAFLPQIKAACHNQENEARTRMILDRMFQDAFGYAMLDIKTEQNIQGRKADYVLSIEGQDVLVVEVKRAGMMMRDRQIFQATSYGAFSGIRWALLTNLMDWQLYRISTGDKIQADQVFAISLKNGLDEESAMRLALISAYGFRRKDLLEKLWLKLGTLSSERLAAAVLNQEVITKIRLILSKESGLPLTQEEVQAAIERHLLHLE